MRIIIGLGNPTKEYEGTRHNVGFSVIYSICDEYNIKAASRKHKALMGRGVIGGESVVVAMPMTYMNLSGDSVRELVDYYKCTNKDIIVIYDDISLDVGKLRIRAKGSAGGHNGVKSIISGLGTDEFPRIKVGVGNKPAGMDLADYVLGHFTKNEQPLIRESVRYAKDAVGYIIENGMAAAMNKYN